ncbi:MAG: hypothetical protein DCO96_05985 [Fluviicola sp. XM-24bin1]|nr:MAG: hypothetical protein DCO96_05985 [Fluviicola sp. XM-24bin1]
MYIKSHKHYKVMRTFIYPILFFILLTTEFSFAQEDTTARISGADEVSISCSGACDCSLEGILSGDEAQYRVYFDVFGTGCETYRLKIIDQNSQMYVVSIDVNFCATLSLDENMLEEAKVWPNPASTEINIPAEIQKIQIFNLSGVLMKEEELSQGQSVMRIQDLFPGTYLVKIEGKEGRISTEKIGVNH